MQSKKYSLGGIGANVEIGKAGPRVRNTAGVVEFRNPADDEFEIVRGDHPVADNDFVTKRYLETMAKVVVTGQIDGGAPPSPADGVVYIVTTAGGGFGLEELWRREASAWVQLTLIDGLTISISNPLSGGTDEYAIGRYMYDLDTTDWVLVGPVSETSKSDRNEVLTVAFGDDGANNLGSEIPSGAIIKKVSVNVTQAFDEAPTLDIGDAGDPDRFMSNAELDLGTVGLYVSDVHYLYGADTQMLATLSDDSQTTGQCQVLVEYRLP